MSLIKNPRRKFSLPFQFLLFKTLEEGEKIKIQRAKEEEEEG